MQQSWQPKRGDVVVRRPRQSEIGPVQIHVERRTVPVRGPSSPMVLVYGFLGLSALGTLLLMLPFSSHESGFTPFIVAMFTAVSAVTVTGLVVVDSGEYWTFFGQVVLILLIFTGGIGFMTSAAFLLIIVGRRLGLESQLAIRDSLGVRQLAGLPSLIRRIGLLAVVVQLLGAVLLFVRFYVFDSLWEGVSVGAALWQSLFLSVSAFNNAGFVILPIEFSGGMSLAVFRTDFIVLAIVSILVVIGGIGYAAIFDILTVRRFRRFSLESKVVITAAAALILIGAVLVFSLERTNPDTLQDLTFPEQVLDSVFNSVTARTAGFAIVDYSLQRDSTTLVNEILMLIGGASASTAGGLKINTFVVVVLAVVATVRGRRHISVFNREIPDDTARRALVIAALYLSFLAMFLVAVSFVENLPLSDIIFETVSAIGTVGLSTGITPELSNPGRVLIAVTMFVGRFGPLTLALLMLGREAPRDYRYAIEQVRIG